MRHPTILARVQFGRLSWTGFRGWWIFMASATLMVLAFAGLALSFFPYIIPDKMLITEAASDPSALFVILIGTIGVLPIIAGYTIYAYWIFRGKAPDSYYVQDLYD